MAIAPGVARALAARAPVVALETAVLALGLPFPQNRSTFLAMARAVENAGAVPAPIALDGGRVHVGLSPALVERLARARGTGPSEDTSRGERVEKVARRDVGRVLAGGALGATTVSATLAMAFRAGIDVCATGGIGGIHLGPGGALDVSADLGTLAECPGILVCAGVKTICDAEATLERLDSLSVPVVGYGSDRFPHFYGGVTDLEVPRIESPEDAARCWRAHAQTGARSALLVTLALDARAALDPAWLARAVRGATALAARRGVRSGALTPFLLDHLARVSKGRTVTANRTLLIANARLAARIARAVTPTTPGYC